MSANVWKIELFGSLCVRGAQREITRFRTQKTGALLAYLAFYANKTHRREEIIERIWPEETPEAGRNRLRVALSALRQEMETSEVSAGSILQTDRLYVSLRLGACSTDTNEFETHLRSAQSAASDAERASSLQKAVDLFRGELLTDYTEDWIAGERQRLTDSCLIALRRLLPLLTKAHQLDAAQEYAHRAITLDPFREESHRVLIQLYIARGRPAAAKRQYQELEQLLHREFGREPSVQTRSLRASFAGNTGRSSSTQAVEKPMYSESFASFPLPPSSRKTNGEGMPSPRTRLFGCEESIARILEMLATPETRLVTLTGLGGTGKTRLALAAAQNLLPTYNGSVWFVPLASVQTQGQMLDALLKTLALRPVGRVSALDLIANALKSQPVLLVLDNYEQLSEKCGPLLSELLDRMPLLHCLVTSRHRLRVAGEYEYSVPTLEVPLHAGTPERLMEFASVQLFVDRAQAVRSDFTITPANTETIAAICRYLEGIPLAIELAAAWAQVLAPAQILSRLSKRFQLLVARHQDAPDRHTSLLRVIDGSYDLLTPPLQHFLQCLSIFHNGWDMEAVEAILSQDSQNDCLEMLTQLRERSLIQAEESDNAMRFRLLETVRDYAAERLDTETQARTTQRHADYFAKLAETAEPHFTDSEAQVWLERLNGDYANLRAALQWLLRQQKATLQTESDSPVAAPSLAFARSLWRFWHVHGEYEEGTLWLQQALEANPQAEPALRGQVLMGVGNLFYEQGNYEQAEAYFQQALVLRRSLQDETGVAHATGSLGLLAYDREEYSEACLLFEQTLEIFRQQDNRRGTALCLANLGNVLVEQDKHSEAYDCLAQALIFFRQAGDQASMAQNLNNLANVVLHTPQFADARSLLTDALLLANSLHSPRNILQSLTGFARLAMLEGRPRQAAVLYGATERLRRKIHASWRPQAQRTFVQAMEHLAALLGEKKLTELRNQGHAMAEGEATQLALSSDFTA